MIPGPGGARTPLLQGFTRDISAGGICVELKCFDDATEARLALHAPVELIINLPFSNRPLSATGRVAWLYKEERSTEAVRCFRIGVEYTSIDDGSRRRLFGYARSLRWIPRLTVLLIALLGLALGGVLAHNQRITRENEELVRSQIEQAERKSVVTAEIAGLGDRKRALEAESAATKERMKELETRIAELTVEGEVQRLDFERELAERAGREAEIAGELKALREGARKLEDTYRSLKERERPTATAVLRQMAEWIKTHRNTHTGLVASFEGDPALEDAAYSYDQALAAQVFLLFGDMEAAAGILEFYESRARTEAGAFYNAYDAWSGRPAETTIHTGPNIWIGIAALQYERRVKDGRFLGLAARAANWAIKNQDAEGGLEGGPAFSWYSTEHNLDAYALFRLLHTQTGQPVYKQAAERTLGWLQKYSYSVKERRMNRGKGDATIATDTFSWAIAAIGPERLDAAGFDPEAIMEYAENQCRVTVSYEKPGGGAAKASGFDFAKAQNLGRGGVISTEWTAQVIVTYQILARHFEAKSDAGKASLYRNKANFFLNELQKLIIASPSRTGRGRGCLPYASIDNVDTGHGWRTPAGRRTGSVAGTAYGIFAWVGYNPFSFDNPSQVVA